MTIGIIGTGHLAEAIVHGFHRSCNHEEILLSPRNITRSANLAERYPHTVHVATSNQAVLDASDILFLTMRAQDADTALSSLRFRESHAVISMMAMVPLASVSQLVTPASTVVRAATLPYVAKMHGPVLVYPSKQLTHSFLEQLGYLEVAKDERQLEILWSLTAMMASHFATIETLTTWATDKSVPKEQAGRFTTDMLSALCSLSREYANGDLTRLVDESQTAGGINEQALDSLHSFGYFDALTKTLDEVVRRMMGGRA